jgi:hypothetical protein
VAAAVAKNKLSPKERASLARGDAVRKAEAGNMWPMIGRVLSDPHLSDDEREYLRRLLEGNDGRRGKAEIRRIEKALVRLRVESLVAGYDGSPRMKKAAAIRQVMRERGRSRSFVFTACDESKKP